LFSVKNGFNFICSQAVKYGDTVYLSGTLGLDSTGKLVEGGAGPEIKKALENIKHVLEASQSSFSSSKYIKIIFNKSIETYKSYLTLYLIRQCDLILNYLSTSTRLLNETKTIVKFFINF